MKKRNIWIFITACLLILQLAAVTCFADARNAEDPGTPESVTTETETSGMPETVIAETPSEFAEATADAEPEGDSLYAYKRLMVFVQEGSLTESYGASEALYYAPGGYYLLTYDTKSQTRAAFQALTMDCGKDRVFVDEPMEIMGKPAQDKSSDTPDSDSVSYGNDLMHLDAVRDYYNENTSEGKDVLVAVLDTGIMSDHEMFSYKKDGKTYSRLQLNQDAYFEDNGIEDTIHGHGTHVAGIIADGTSNHIQILPVRVLNRYGSGSDATLYNGLLYARDHGAQIINMSLGFRQAAQSTKDLLDPVFKKFFEEGILCVASAGNDKTDAFYPSNCAYVTSVSALKYENGILEFDSGYSNFGDISFCAPGTDINSAWVDPSKPYTELSGTSMACPHIVAAAAMYKAVNPEYTPQEIKYMMYYRSEHFNFLDDESFVQYGSGMPYFRKGYVEKVPSVRSVNFKLKQTTLVYSGPKTYEVEVPTGTRVVNGKTITYVSGEDYWPLSFSGCWDVGIATVGIRGIEPNLVGDKYYKYTIIPAGTSLTKLTGGKKKITVKWKKQGMKMSVKRINGYQIQIATNKSFTKGKKTLTVKGYSNTSKKITKLKKKKKYYVRIRTFMKVNGKTYYSKWSGKKAVKTKKK